MTQVTRHEFLAQVHDLLKPEVYLETGVQYGLSLALASYSKVAIGIDPKPLVAPVGNQVIHAMASDEFFARSHDDLVVDMAFIDGLHLAEQVYRDVINVTRHSHQKTVIILDDVLPFTQAMAAREQCPGDWTGDVWKAALMWWERGQGTFVNTAPTGTFVIFAEDIVSSDPAFIVLKDDLVPDSILNRDMAKPSAEILDMIADRVGGQMVTSQ